MCSMYDDDGSELSKVKKYLLSKGLLDGGNIEYCSNFSCPKCHIIARGGPGQPIVGLFYKEIESIARHESIPYIWDISLFHCGNCYYKYFISTCIDTKSEIEDIRASETLREFFEMEEEPPEPDLVKVKKYFPELYE